MKLLVDQMWPALLAEQLRQRGHDVVAVIERKDLTHAADDTVFETARREERAVFTEMSATSCRSPLTGWAGPKSSPASS